jgi:hypothetical protein
LHGFSWSLPAAYRGWRLEPYFFLDYFHSSPATSWHVHIFDGMLVWAF